MYYMVSLSSTNMVQRRAARLVSNNYERLASVTEMLNNIRWPTMKQRRDNLCLIMFFKIANDLVDVTTDGILYQQIDNLRDLDSYQLLWMVI